MPGRVTVPPTTAVWPRMRCLVRDGRFGTPSDFWGSTVSGTLRKQGCVSVRATNIAGVCECARDEIHVAALLAADLCTVI